MVHGTKVGSFAWNHHRHLEAYFGVPGTGAILHMINIRLSPEHIAYVINHAGDEILLVDDNLFPHLEKLAPYLKTVKHYIIMGDSTEIPETTLENVHSYEALLAEASEDYVFPEDLDENTPAGMCYTSATTGNPKGVVYTHRGLVLHSYALGLADAMGYRKEMLFCQSCQCSMPMHGECHSPQSFLAQHKFCRGRASIRSCCWT